jgi:hypothetical protein
MKNTNLTYLWDALVLIATLCLLFPFLVAFKVFEKVLGWIEDSEDDFGDSE